MIKLARWWLGSLVLLLALAACSKPAAPQATQADFDRSIQNYQTGLNTVAADADQDLALQALGNMPSGAPGLTATSLASGLMSLSARPVTPSEALKLLGGMIPLTDQDLPRGKWAYNPSTLLWEEDPNYSGDDLVLTWPFKDDTHSAQLTFDWNHNGASTVSVRESDGTTSEAPQDMQITLEVDGQGAGTLSGQFAWYDCSGAPIAEPTSVTLNASAGVSDRIELTFNLSASDTRVSSSGSFSANAGGDSASFAWDVRADGTMQRDASCFSTGFDTSSGHVNLQSSTQASGSSSSLEFNTDFSLNFDSSGDLDSIELTNGYVKTDGVLAVTFSGTLDDANNNCIPGEHVTLVFADGSQTLEEYLIHQGATGCD